MESSNGVLVALDFTPSSVDAFQRAQRIAAWKGAPLVAIHVIDVPADAPVDIYMPAVVISEAIGRELVASAWRKWGALVKHTGVEGAKFVVEVGNPRDHILACAQREKPAMLVLGANSRSDARPGMGATAAACAQYAAARVLVVREGQTDPFRAVVACIDFTETSRLALEEAIAIAAEDGAALHVLHVYSDPWHGLKPPSDITRNMPDFADRYRRAVEDRVREFCRPLAHELGAINAEYHGVLAERHADGIKAFLERKGCDLAVLGTRGKFNLRDFFWGSTAEGVVRDAPCSVLVVKPPSFVPFELYQPLEDTRTVLPVPT